jgi:hypothetical protein
MHGNPHLLLINSIKKAGSFLTLPLNFIAFCNFKKSPKPPFPKKTNARVMSPGFNLPAIIDCFQLIDSKSLSRPISILFPPSETAFTSARNCSK